MLKVVLGILYNCISENPKRPANRRGVGRVNPLAIRTWRLVSRVDAYSYSYTSSSSSSSYRKRKRKTPLKSSSIENFYLSHIKARADREGGVLSSPNLEQMNKIRYWWCAAASRADTHRAMVACDWDPTLCRFLISESN